MARDRQWVVLDPTQSPSTPREPTAREIVEGEDAHTAHKDAPAPRASEADDAPER